MQFPTLQPAVLERRYKRFLADVVLPSGERVTAHCPNTGAMTGCAEPDWPVWLSASTNPKRKLAWTLELVQSDTGLVCVHSALANTVIAEALDAKQFPDFADIDGYRAEVRYGAGSRADFMLSVNSDAERQAPERDTTARIVVEVKAVTWHRGGGRGEFPDAVSERARKHLLELTNVCREGGRAALIFCALHEAIDHICPASSVDPAYASALNDAAQAGVTLLGLSAAVSPHALVPGRLLPVRLQ